MSVTVEERQFAQAYTITSSRPIFISSEDVSEASIRKAEAANIILRTTIDRQSAGHCQNSTHVYELTVSLRFVDNHLKVAHVTTVEGIAASVVSKRQFRYEAS